MAKHLCDRASSLGEGLVQDDGHQGAQWFARTNEEGLPFNTAGKTSAPTSNGDDRCERIGWFCDDEEADWGAGQQDTGDGGSGGEEVLESEELESESESEEELESDNDDSSVAADAESSEDLPTLVADFGNATCSKPGVSGLAHPGAEFYPYATQGIAMADILFNGPRARFSRTQKLTTLEMSRQLHGKKKGPSLHALTQAQNSLETMLGDPTQRRTTQAGTVWYENNISSAIAKDISNPVTRRDMQMYPHLEGNGQRATQVWHGAKMLYGIPDDQMTPMMRNDSDQIFYVNELVKLSDGRLFIPRRWFLRGELKEKWCFGDYVHNTPCGAVIERSSVALRPSVPVSSFMHTYNELMRSTKLFEGFAHDVSGGVSKQWNKYIACYMSNATIPREALQKELNVRYVGATNQMSASELLSGIASSIEHAFANPTVTFDALTGREVLEGVIRDPQKTLETVQARFALALQSGARSKVDDDMALTGVKDGIGQPIVEDIVTRGIKLRKVSADNPSPKPDEIHKILSSQLELAKERGAINALLEMDGVNIHEDTPTEILHTVLLGVVKYFWAQSIHIIKRDHHMDTFCTRLRSLNSKGLGIPSILADYMCSYSGTLIGKHFKTLAQVMPFVAQDLVPQRVQDAWLLLGRLVVLLWVTEIDELDLYLTALKDVIDKFLVTAAICSPGILTEKPKFHFLVHLPRFIRRFGPAILFSTERYESYHAIFRAAMVKSNRQAPSRDAAKAIASIDRVQHICMGGYWRKIDGSGWEQASSVLLQFVRKNKVFSKILGIYQKPDPVPGTVTMVTCTKSKGKARMPLGVPWLSTRTSKLGVPVVEPGGFEVGNSYESVKHVIACSGDTITAGTHAIIQIGADLICAVNLQHDCVRSSCNEVEQMSVMREREVSAHQKCFVKHKDSAHFVLNTQALHNNKYIVAALPSELQKRAYTVGDAQAHMASAALSLRNTHDKKTAARKAATKRVKEEAALAALNAANAGVEDENNGEGVPDIREPSNEAKGPAVVASGSGVLQLLEAHNPAQPVAGSSNLSPSHFSSCTVPVLKRVCRLFSIKTAASIRKVDLISELDSYFARPNTRCPTKQELEEMKTELSLKRKREPDAIGLNDGEGNERAKKQG
ncbi:hypothetical protein FRC06_011798 [Ceratobasidium sp. 370]|nr:hypothetical protein FRC06_011798 [Ceratobasidium sp. 370]